MRLTDLVSDLETKLEQLKSRLGVDDDPSAADPENETWMPPQQQKLELLKKAVGVENEYDNEESDCGCGHEESDEELDILRRNAGIATVMHLTGDDPDLDN